MNDMALFPLLTFRALKLGTLCTAVFLTAANLSSAAPIVLADFEGIETPFASAPTTSGTNRNVTSATADLSNIFAFTGTGSERLTITPPNPGTSTDFPTDQFRLRFLSGGGAPSSNVNLGPDGYFGYFLRTTTEGLVTAPALDDGAALELGVFLPVIADGQWHLYQFNLDDPEQWNAFAGTAPNGEIDGPTVTLDSIFFQGATASSPEFYLDTVAYNTSGDLTALVPEPSAAGLLLCSAVGLLLRRKRH
jgi:hypothetical protein